MPSRVTFHPNRVSITPHPRFVHFEDTLEVSRWYESLERNPNLSIIGNPFLMSRMSKTRLKDRIMAMYRLATPRTIVRENKKLLYNFRCSFITLTLPAPQMHTDKEIKELALNQFLVELRKHYDVQNYVWKAELQAKGNIHFHIITDKYINYFALRRRWNRILAKLGYIKKFQERMLKLTFEEYHANTLKFNKRSCKLKSMQRYKKGLESNWRNPNSVDVKMVRNEKEVAIYMAKYMVKDAVEEKEEGYSKEELDVLERGKEFGRSWFCSRSLSRLETKFSFGFNEIRDLLEQIVKADGTKLFIGEFFKVWYFDYSKLDFEVREFLRGWLLSKCYDSGYALP